MSMHHALLAGLISVATASNVAAPATASGAHADTVLCADTPRQTVADMRIEESHLDQAAALDAADRLRARIAAGELYGDLAFGVFNAVKVIDGHVRREQALAARREAGPDAAETRAATEAFCTWLADEGFWYD